jgi:hypothetical protein
MKLPTFQVFERTLDSNSWVAPLIVTQEQFIAELNKMYEAYPAATSYKTPDLQWTVFHNGDEIIFAVRTV